MKITLGTLTMVAVLACGLAAPIAVAGSAPAGAQAACEIFGRPWIDDAKAPRPDCAPIANNPWVENY